VKVAIASKTPLAASPLELWKALRRYTDVDARLINWTTRYPDGRSFPFDLVAGRDNDKIKATLAEADVWHINNYLPEGLAAQRNGHQRVIAQFHSIPKLGNWAALKAFADASYTIRQPLQEREYGLPALPNIIDPDEYRPARRDEHLVIAFAPTNKAPLSMPQTKGYAEVKRVLNSVALGRDVEVLVIEGVSYEANLCLKQRAHILIDDVVTGNWHRTSLEGLCFGCAVINKNPSMPFVQASLATLRARLLWLIDHPATLAEIQEQGRVWVLQNWHAMDMVKLYVEAYGGGAQ
jgi:hypothetical protein